MRAAGLYPILKAGLIAGLAAGLSMGLFHFVLTEPVMDRAIALEEEVVLPPGQDTNYEPVVSRTLQKAMLVVGAGLYGLAVGAVFALIFFALPGRFLMGRRTEIKAAALAILMWWSVALLPFLKYPANPPGVGNPETVYFRQSIYIQFLTISALAIVAAFAAYSLLSRWWSSVKFYAGRLAVSAALYGCLVVLLFVLMPANPDDIAAPADLVWDFRILSLSGQVLFWAVLGGTSALLLRRLTVQRII